MKERAILHSDANCFYASVETVLDPSLRGKAVAVCGSTDERHGIVLAKSEKAKKAGIKTGMANWQARELCRELIIVPPQYEYYLKFSQYLHKIYKRYTDQVEPFGMDECWLDVTDLQGEPRQIAEEIRQAVKDELGLTVSIGVSFNKIFAKLGSDLKKPDAVTEITKDNFKEKVWPLACSELLYCGRATTAKLGSSGIHTIGDIARLPVDIMKCKLGKNGVMLWKYANGLDESRVAHEDYTSPAKSVAHGITCVADLVTPEEAKKVIVALSQDIGHKLRLMRMCASAVHLHVRDNSLNWYGWQKHVEFPTQDEKELARETFGILEGKYGWRNPIRSLSVSAIGLQSVDTPTQLGIFYDNVAYERRQRLNKAIDAIRDTYGKNSIVPAAILDEAKMPRGKKQDIIMPGYMYS